MCFQLTLLKPGVKQVSTLAFVLGRAVRYRAGSGVGPAEATETLWQARISVVGALFLEEGGRGQCFGEDGNYCLSSGQGAVGSMMRSIRVTEGVLVSEGSWVGSIPSFGLGGGGEDLVLACLMEERVRVVNVTGNQRAYW